MTWGDIAKLVIGLVFVGAFAHAVAFVLLMPVFQYLEKRVSKKDSESRGFFVLFPVFVLMCFSTVVFVQFLSSYALMGLLIGAMINVVAFIYIDGLAREEVLGS